MTTVTYSSEGRVGRLTISRPDRRNALNHAALDEMHDGIRRATAEELRVLILTGAGGQFCSGADLKELEDLEFTNALRHMLDDLAGLPIPTIASISGACMGLGMQLALACDLRIATEDARFAVPVAKLGLMVDHWTVQRLALCAGHSTARWMLLTAEPVEATRAVEVGLVNRLAESHEDADLLAERIARLAPLALEGSKLGLDLLERPSSEADPENRYRAAFERAWASSDLVEGRRAFHERRPPDFEGR
jgi:enoyl-CoA hydratase